MTFHRILQYLIQCAFGTLLFLVKAYICLLCLKCIFIPCVIQSFLSSILLYLTVKLAWKMFKKVHRRVKHTVRICSYINRFPSFFFSRVWKFMIVSLSINLILCFKGNLLIVAYTFFIVRI